MAWRLGAAPFVFCALLAGVLGYQQFLAGVVLRDRAAAGAWPALVPARVARGIDDGNPWFASRALRYQLARRAVDDGEFALAAQRIALLAASPERAALEGRLAELEGDGATASRDYLAAGDREGVQRRVQALAGAGRIDEALALERQLLERLQDDPEQVDALADTWLSIGRLEQMRAYGLGSATPAGRAAAERSADAYARAVALAPLSERYLLSAGTQALNLGDLDAAAGYFTRARDADPSAAEAYAGLGETALRRGDRVRARAELERAERLGPDMASVRRLAQELER